MTQDIPGTWISQKVFVVQARIARKGRVTVLDVDPMRVRSLILCHDVLENRRSMRRMGMPLKRCCSSILRAGKPVWYLV